MANYYVCNLNSHMAVVLNIKAIQPHWWLGAKAQPAIWNWMFEMIVNEVPDQSFVRRCPFLLPPRNFVFLLSEAWLLPYSLQVPWLAAGFDEVHGASLLCGACSPMATDFSWDRVVTAIKWDKLSLKAAGSFSASLDDIISRRRR